jgi:hypothetical protein
MEDYVMALNLKDSDYAGKVSVKLNIWPMETDAIKVKLRSRDHSSTNSKHACMRRRQCDKPKDVFWRKWG